MRKHPLTPPPCVLVAALLLAPDIRAAIVISEIMYHPPQGEGYEYIELHNNGSSAVAVGGWALADGVNYIIPAGTSIPAGGYLIICQSKAAFTAAYPAVPPGIVLGDWTGALDNDGERVALIDGAAAVRVTFRYEDDSPWDFLADGFGASLELLCDTASPDQAENWRASPVPATLEAFGGSPGAPGAVHLCPPVRAPRPRVLISEILYHPVLEEAIEDRHEFVEIYSAEPAPVNLAGWRIAGGVDYVFGAGESIAPGEYKVIAKNKAALAAVYGLDPAAVSGNYSRVLDNGGDKVALIGPDGQGIDSVTYDDDFPWPLAADALGAGESWLPPALLPLANHRYKGHSLERVSFDHPAGEVYNWAPSPLDGATPGRANASARAAPLPIVAGIDVLQADGGAGLIRSNDSVLVRTRFAPVGGAAAVELQYFIDNVSTTGEPVATAPMFDDGQTQGDQAAGDGIFSCILPARPDNSIVRYRIRADRGAGLEVVAPRPTDPNPWFAYFVTPVIATTTRLYHIFISPADWTQMWDNIQGGRVSGCTPRAGWNADVPAVFIHEGRVFDAHVRYQGSRYNRTNGRNLSSWPYPGPARPNPVRALSWRISLPRYATLEGRGDIVLNKNNQGCPGLDAGVGYRLFAMAGVPAPDVRYVRLHINGGYYHYMVEYERPGEEMMERYHREQALASPGAPREKVGHLFKSAGCNCDEGPYGWGDERQLTASCGFTAADRYRYTYDRKTHEWDTHDEFSYLIDNLHAARAGGIPAMRSYFAEFFDLELLLNHIAIMNWSVPFDDMFQNHFLYQRLSDGKWILMPWDLDLNWGGWRGADSSIYGGEQGDPDNRSGWWNYLKDAFLKSYRAEFEERLLELNNTILHPTVVNGIIDEVLAGANPTEAAQAPSGIACSFSGDASNFRSFASARFQVVNTRLSSVQVDAGFDQTVLQGSIVQFDARNSRPDPGPNATYTWSNGMTGDFPTFRFDEAGEFTITLTLRVNGTPFQDSVKITVIGLPEKVFVESGGQVVMEAESFHVNDRHGAATAWWDPASARAGYSGSGYMQAMETAYTKYPADYGTIAPELRTFIRFEQPGTYRVWIRAFSDSTNYDSCHIGLDGLARDESFAQRFVVDASQYNWSVDTRGQGVQTVAVPQPGIHFLSIWIRESGQIIDKIILTRSTAFTPAGNGPAESEQAVLNNAPPFIRGDANGDKLIDIGDPVAVLVFLFLGSSALTCEDHGDVDDNGVLEVTDAVTELLYLFRHGPPPAAPFPGAGADSTLDPYTCGGP